MAGRRHSKTPVRPKRTQTQAIHLNRRIVAAQTAQTPEQRAAAAFDGLRIAARRSPERGQRALDDVTGQMLSLAAWITQGERE